MNDVSSAMGSGRIYQTVQTGTCEAKGPNAPCGGGGTFTFQFIKSKLKFTFKSRFGFILPTRVDNTQTCGSKSM